jgi:predicted PurR-regulated permease PerM
MTERNDKEVLQRRVVIGATLVITAVFLLMIRLFLVPLLLAGIFTGLLYPIYRWLLAKFKGRRVAASLATLAIFLLVVVGPLSSLVGLVVAQAAEAVDAVTQWFEERGRVPGLVAWVEERVPIADRIEPYREEIIQKGGELAGQAGGVLLRWLKNTTAGTATFLLQLFVFFYAMFFFLMDGPELVRRMLYYLPLGDEDEDRMLDKFVSVTRATIKGTLVIGLLQGLLAGLAFAVVGINGWVFWATVMAVLSILPGIGSALIWGPAVLWLLFSGSVGAGIGLAIWCVGVVGTVDNFLRPRLVGSDTELPDLLILLGTLGGLILFGAAGVILGPIIAALFVTIWEIYGRTFQDVLDRPERAGGAAGSD